MTAGIQANPNGRGARTAILGIRVARSRVTGGKDERLTVRGVCNR